MADQSHFVSTPRVAIVGVSGSGKSTLAKRLATRWRVPVLELDALYHQANWTVLDEFAFRSRVETFVAAPAWICEGSYAVVRDLIWSRVELIIFLDYSRVRVMGRLLRRSLWRLLWRTSLWNGNRERWRNFVSRDPERNILLWSWHTHAPRRQEVPTLAATLAPHATFVHVRSQAQCRALLRSLDARYGVGPLPRSSSSQA